MLRVFRLPFLIAIRFYQKVLSPGFPSACRFYPSCSEYAYQCFEKYNPIKAFYYSLIRILRCHPWSRGGIDPIP